MRSLSRPGRMPLYQGERNVLFRFQQTLVQHLLKHESLLPPNVQKQIHVLRLP